MDVEVCKFESRYTKTGSNVSETQFFFKSMVGILIKKHHQTLVNDFDCRQLAVLINASMYIQGTCETSCRMEENVPFFLPVKIVPYSFAMDIRKKN